MGDIKTTTAAIVSALEGSASIKAAVLTDSAGTLDQILEHEDTHYPLVLVTYAGAEFSNHELLGSRQSDANRTWRIYTLTRTNTWSTDGLSDSSDLLELVAAVLQGVVVDGGGGELWPVSDELISSARGTVVYALDISATTRLVGI